MEWYGKLLIGARILLIAVAIIASFHPTKLGATAFVLLLSTYIHPLFCYWRDSRNSTDAKAENEEVVIQQLTYDDLRSEWKKRKRDDKKAVKATSKWFADRGQDVLERFLQIQNNTECKFAKQAKLWAAPRVQEGSGEDDLETYVRDFVVDPFFVFSAFSDSENLDGFVIELPKRHCEDLPSFCRAVYRVLKAMADLSPTRYNCMAETRTIGLKGWVFSFNGITYFITTFAPFYPANICRYAFNAETGYLLFQPEVSFARHAVSMPSDAPGMDDVRGQIRAAYRDAGREYVIVEPTASVAAHTVFSPENGDTVEWWRHAIQDEAEVATPEKGGEIPQTAFL